MSHSTIRGIEITRETDRLVLRNTWSVQTLGGHLLLVIGAGFFGFFGLVPVEAEPPASTRLGLSWRRSPSPWPP